MPKKTTRMKEIVALLHQNGEISVKELSRHLLASPATVRRYLDDLEEEGILRRTHGGAILHDSYAIDDTNNYLIGKETEKNVRQKSGIGLKAASLVQPGETVAFDIGSTTYFIAKYIERDLHLSALCVTFACARELYHKQNVNLILTGGHLHRDSDVITSDEGIDIIRKIRTDKVFLSAGGIDEKLGLTCYHDFHVVIKRALMESSKKIILVADSSKFGNVTPSYYADLKEIHALITDGGIPETYRRALADFGVELLI